MSDNPKANKLVKTPTMDANKAGTKVTSSTDVPKLNKTKLDDQKEKPKEDRPNKTPVDADAENEVAEPNYPTPALDKKDRALVSTIGKTSEKINNAVEASKADKAKLDELRKKKTIEEGKDDPDNPGPSNFNSAGGFQDKLANVSEMKQSLSVKYMKNFKRLRRTVTENPNS
jgi:hypothetical protein